MDKIWNRNTRWLIAAFACLALAGCTNGPGPGREPEEGTITNLYDAFGRDSLLTKDFGFSCLIRYRGKTILFDAGSNADVFKTNTDMLGIDLRSVDLVVVSHPHFDHINGLDYLLRLNPDVRIFFPSDIFWGAPVPYDATGQEPGVRDSLPRHMQYFEGGPTTFTIQQSGRFWNAHVEHVKESAEIAPGLTLIATRSDYLGYFSCYPGRSFVPGQFAETEEDCRRTGLPELSLTLATDKGDVLIVGCSHTGVERIIAAAKKVTQNPVELVYGGFHMLPFDRDQTLALVEEIRTNLQVHRVAPAHCTGHLAFKLLRDKFGEDYVYAGLGEVVRY
jgi:7,8-dihydropterin-6-yl-methyl-4-(beta-D-ribofuranosyl)aminobenzene 5'-phosphate synthase